MASPTILALSPPIRAVAVSYAFDVRTSVKDIAERLKVLQEIPQEDEVAPDNHNIKQEVIDLNDGDAGFEITGRESILGAPVSPSASLPPTIEDHESEAESRPPDQEQTETRSNSPGISQNTSRPQALDDEIAPVESRQAAEQLRLAIWLVDRRDMVNKYPKQHRYLDIPWGTKISRVHEIARIGWSLSKDEKTHLELSGRGIHPDELLHDLWSAGVKTKYFHLVVPRRQSQQRPSGTNVSALAGDHPDTEGNVPGLDLSAAALTASSVAEVPLGATTRPISGKRRFQPDNTTTAGPAKVAKGAVTAKSQPRRTVRLSIGRSKALVGVAKNSKKEKGCPVQVQKTTLKQRQLANAHAGHMRPVSPNAPMRIADVLS